MANHKPLTDETGEVRELKAADFKRFRPATEVLSSTLLAKLAKRTRGPQKAPTQDRITISYEHAEERNRK